MVIRSPVYSNFLTISPMDRYFFCSLLFLLFSLPTSQNSPTTLLWPLPANTTQGQTSFVVSPCAINYIISSPLSNYLKLVIRHYEDKVFKCQDKPGWQVLMNIVVIDDKVLVPTKVEHELYSLTIRENGKWELRADYFPGFVRGFETFSQLFQINERNQSIIRGLPIFIDDQPNYFWRGLMIDTSRHFLPVETIKLTIDALMYSKMNVLHWHIVDEDSFPLEIPACPELSQFGKLSGSYSPEEVKEIVNYAMSRAIRVVPEIDTPAHSESWGRSQKYKEIALNCNGVYKGQLDPTLPLTWSVLTDVLAYTNQSFPDSYVHFGGDEVTYECWGERESIKQYMREHGIETYFDLSVDFRERQKQLWQDSISPSKKIIYWANQEIDLPLNDDDVVQWWGISANVDRLKGRKNEVILSNYDLTYLDKGFGEYDGYFADFYYQHWRKMYAFQPKIQGVNVIGGEVCMWDEVGNAHTHQQKVILRANVLSERLWNTGVQIDQEIANVASRLAAQARRLRQRGLKVSPVTVGLCESVDMSICFN